MTEQDRREFLRRMVGVAGAFTAPTVLSFALSEVAEAQPSVAIAQGSNTGSGSGSAGAVDDPNVAPNVRSASVSAPRTVRQGEAFEVQSFDMPADLPVEFHLVPLSGTRQRLGSGMTKGDGTLSEMVTMPSDAPVGPAQVEVRTNPLVAVVSVTVVAGLPAQPAAVPLSRPAPATELAYTGPRDSLLSTGLGLIAAGAGAAALSARRLRNALRRDGDAGGGVETPDTEV